MLMITDHILPNGRKLIGTDEDVIAALNEELKEINVKLAILKPKVEKDVRESREKHRKLWNY
jgi:hypothetical protein